MKELKIIEALVNSSITPHDIGYIISPDCLEAMDILHKHKKPMNYLLDILPKTPAEYAEIENDYWEIIQDRIHDKIKEESIVKNKSKLKVYDIETNSIHDFVRFGDENMVVMYSPECGHTTNTLDKVRIITL